MPAAPIIVLAAVETGAAAAIGTAIVGSAVSAGVATAVGVGVVSGGITAAQGGDASDILQSAVIGGVTAGIGSEIASGVSQSLVEAGVDSAAASIAGSATAGALKAGAMGGDPLQGALTAGLTTGANQAVGALIDEANIDSFDRATASQLAAENAQYTPPTSEDVLSAMANDPGVVDVPVDVASALPVAPDLTVPQDQLSETPSNELQPDGALPVEAPEDVAGGLPSADVNELVDEPYMTAESETTPPVDQPPVEEAQFIPKFNLSSAAKIMGALGMFGGQGSQQTTTGGLQGTQQATGDSGIPWLNTSTQMLAGQAPRSPDIVPELLSALQDRGIGLAHGGSIRGYAAGDLVSTCLNEALKSLSAAPKFYPVKCNMLTMPAVKRSPLALAGLKQLQSQISSRGNIGAMAKGGLPAKYQEAAPDGHKPEFITGLTGYYAGGRGTGQSDDIPAMLHDGDYVIDAEAVSALGDGSSKAGNEVLMNFMKQVPHRMAVGGNPVPAKIADGEVVLPESFVTALGGGDNKRGARMLDQMRQHLREHKRSAPNSRIPPKAKTPMEYLRGVKG